MEEAGHVTAMLPSYWPARAARPGDLRRGGLAPLRPALLLGLVGGLPRARGPRPQPPPVRAPARGERHHHQAGSGQSVLCQVGDKAVLVTGCDTGFGLALAKHLRGDNSVNNISVSRIFYSEVWASRCLRGVCWLTSRARAPRSCGSSPAPSCTWSSWTSPSRRTGTRPGTTSRATPGHTTLHLAFI